MPTVHGHRVTFGDVHRSSPKHVCGGWPELYTNDVRLGPAATAAAGVIAASLSVEVAAIGAVVGLAQAAESDSVVLPSEPGKTGSTNLENGTLILVRVCFCEVARP